MIQQRLNLGPQKNLKHVPSSSPNLLIESPNLLIRSFTSKAASVSTRSYVLQELWILFSTTFNYIIFLSPKIMMTYFLHRTKLFVLHTTSPEFVH